jgi:tetratricopeptide (TPR) repeat protein
MRLSDSINYMEHGKLYAQGDLRGAANALRRCIAEMDPATERDKIAFLWQRMGSLAFEEGRIGESVHMYEKAQEICPESLILKVQFARFLHEKVKLPDRADAICDEVVSTYKSKQLGGSFAPNENVDCEKMALELKSRIMLEK